MIDILNRVRNKELQAKIVTAEEAAAYIKPGMNVGTSGFTPSGYPKAVPLALAERMKKDPFKINLWTGASTGQELDGALAEAHGIAFRMPYQTNKTLRAEINAGEVDYCDLHLSESAQLARYGYLGGKIDVAIVEACAITEEGNIIPTTSMGNTASYVQSADVVIVEVNVTQPLELEGMHDIYVPLDPPHRLPIPLVKVNDRIGTPYIPCTPDKIKFIVPCDIKDHTRAFGEIDENSKKMSHYFVEFLQQEIKAGRMPKNLLPLQSGVGNVAKFGTDFKSETKSTGAVLLDNEYIKFTKNGKSVLIGGMSDYPYYEFYTPDDDVPSRTLWEEFAEKAKNNFTILLHHQPEYIAEDAKKTDIDLIVCGHTHGGQIQLPFIGGVIAPNQGLFPKYDKGEFDLDGTKMIVCAGLSNHVFIPRINNQVEIGVINIS